MPRGVPVATFAIGEAGATNAALYAASILATADSGLTGKLDRFRKDQEQLALSMELPPQT
jgi:5-(carboxyamino)imidazole ribonucleotide mutase